MPLVSLLKTNDWLTKVSLARGSSRKNGPMMSYLLVKRFPISAVFSIVYWRKWKRKSFVTAGKTWLARNKCPVSQPRSYQSTFLLEDMFLETAAFMIEIFTG